MTIHVHNYTLQEHEAHEEGELVAFWQAAPGGAGDVEAGVATPLQVLAGPWLLTFQGGPGWPASESMLHDGHDYSCDLIGCRRLHSSARP